MFACPPLAETLTRGTSSKWHFTLRIQVNFNTFGFVNFSSQKEVHSSTPFCTISYNGWLLGIEPRLAEPQSAVLPLNYSHPS